MFQTVARDRLTAKQALGDGALHVWWWPEHLQPAAASRRARTDAILRALLARYLPLGPEGLRFGRESKGRPYLVHPGAPDFNLSDTVGGTVLAVAHGGRVGIDIERIERRPPVLRLAARWFAPGEAEALGRLDPESARAAFLRHWTAKEAACKATGTGIFGFLPSWRFAIDDGNSPPRLIGLPADAGDASRWTFHRLAPLASYTVVLACRDLAAAPEGFAVVE
jgi:4'-phosphopantetheinyl transferase